MGLHERAWSGLNLLVYGKTPLLPMQIEQSIVGASPDNEVRLESFEEYPDALDFCKDKKSIGFIFLLENCGQLPLHDVFSQLGKPYESKGWPTFGVLIHEGTESFVGMRTIQRCPNLLGYFAATDFTDKSKVASTLQTIWNRFTEAFEKNIIPAPLQETFLSLASETINKESLHFRDRISSLLSGNLNVSWIDTVALRWAPVVSAISTNHMAALAPHETLIQICKTADFIGDRSTLLSIITSKASLCARIATTAAILDEKRIAGTLVETLDNIRTQSKPGAPALLRHIASASDRIIKVADEELLSTGLEQTG